MVDVISKGAVIRRIEHADTMKLAVDYLSTEAVLVKSLGSNAWVLLNGWKVKPVVAGAGYVAPGATQSNITTARDGMGAGFTFNLPKLSRAINSQTANPTTAAQRAEKIIQKSSASGQPVGRCRQRHHVGALQEPADKIEAASHEMTAKRSTTPPRRRGFFSHRGIPTEYQARNAHRPSLHRVRCRS